MAVTISGQEELDDRYSFQLSQISMVISIENLFYCKMYILFYFYFILNVFHRFPMNSAMA